MGKIIMLGHTELSRKPSSHLQNSTNCSFHLRQFRKPVLLHYSTWMMFWCSELMRS